MMAPYKKLATTLVAGLATTATTGLFAPAAFADPTLTATPPAEAKSLVAAPTSSAAPPTPVATPDYKTSASLAAGGAWATGNTQTLAASVNGRFDMRRGMNGFSSSIVGNYAEGVIPATATTPESNGMVTTAENLTGRLRYDRYVLEPLSLFLIGTWRHDKMQGLSMRSNIDPGLDYLFVNTSNFTFWGEVGYDFQYDIRLDSASVEASPVVDKYFTDNSGRLFLGAKGAANKDVTFATGMEYLQSLEASTRYRLNYDALIASNIGGGFAVSAGFTLRYDHDPLAGKKDLDTMTTMSLVYSYSDAPAPK